MAKPLDEFINSYESTKILKDNLRANLDNFTNLTKSEKENLMRLNLVMIRQCLEDFGAGMKIFNLLAYCVAVTTLAALAWTSYLVKNNYILKYREGSYTCRQLTPGELK